MLIQWKKETEETKRSDSLVNELWGLAFLRQQPADWRIIWWIIDDQSAIEWQKTYYVSHETSNDNLVSLHLYCCGLIGQKIDVLHGSSSSEHCSNGPMQWTNEKCKADFYYDLRCLHSFIRLEKVK